jgi:lycopene beta-cyclase
MTQTIHVDLAILGGGCAGLSLARELAALEIKKNVAVFEPRDAYQDDRSWCFWATEQHPLTALVSHSWSSWLFGQEGQDMQARDCAGHHYQYIRSADFYRESLKALGNCPAINLHLGSAVSSVTPHEDGWKVVLTNQNTYIAQQVVDTRPPAQEVLDCSTLFQCFLGAEIKLERPLRSNQDQMELMTDMRSVNGEFCFTYVLPYAPDHLLVEVTFFSRTPLTRGQLQSELDHLLTQRGWSDARTIRTECASLPMGLPEPPKNLAAPISAGLRGGALRPSSGYGFMRIQRWAQSCAKLYHERGDLLPQTRSGFWLEQMDKLFLAVLKKEPRLAPLIFERLLGKLEPERFIRFMNDRASLSDCLHVVACLPKMPFLRALVSRRSQSLP